MRINPRARSAIPGLALAFFTLASAFAQQPAGGAGAQERGGAAFGALSSTSKEPIKIDADRLDVFDRENRAVYAGNVVAVQGDTTMRCTTLIIFFERERGGGASGAGEQGDAIRRIECLGPVTIISKDQIATGDNAVYDRTAGRVVMTGDVALSQGPNVTRGDRLVYDVDRGVANVEAKKNERVRGLFVPGSNPEAAAPRSQ